MLCKYTVDKLKKQIEKLPDDMPIIIETENGHKFGLLTAKKRNFNTGHKFIKALWLPIDKSIKF